MKSNMLFVMIALTSLNLASTVQASDTSGGTEDEPGAVHGVCPKQITCTLNFAVNQHANPDDPSLSQTQITGIATATCPGGLGLAPGQNFGLMPKGAILTLRNEMQLFTRAVMLTPEGGEKEIDIISPGAYPSGLYSAVVSPSFQLAYSVITPSEASPAEGKTGGSMISENYCYYTFEGSVMTPAPSNDMGGGSPPQFDVKMNLTYKQAASTTNLGVGRMDAWSELNPVPETEENPPPPELLCNNPGSPEVCYFST